MILTIEKLIESAQQFAMEQSKLNHETLFGVTDGKAVGTYVEHKFKNFLKSNYQVEIGNSASGLDLPGEINTDIKVTSIKQPQSSCPFKASRQKIFGLGYNLLVFVYDKVDIDDKCYLNFLNCTFIKAERTGDYTTTMRISEMLDDGADKEDLIGYFNDKGIPGDEITHSDLADDVLNKKPKIGYLTISNALQWRLQYKRVIGLNNEIEGVINFDNR